MTSYEIVKRTLDYDEPERVARSFLGSDCMSVHATTKTHATEWEETAPGNWYRTDEWGNTWHRIDATSKGEVQKGVLENIDDIDRYEFPDYSKPEDYEDAREKIAANPDVWKIGGLPGFTFNIARKLRKLDQYLMDILLERDKIRVLHDKIDAMLVDMIKGYANAGADCIFFPEDWGTQAQTLISPELWKEEYFPRFVKLCGAAHDGGMRVGMHSCGKITAIIPGLIDAGIEILQFDQPTLHGLDALAELQTYGKITYWCPVDIQRTLQSQDEGIIRAAVREYLDTLWKGRGGFMATRYPDDTAIGLNPKWQDIACDEFIRYGVQRG